MAGTRGRAWRAVVGTPIGASAAALLVLVLLTALLAPPLLGERAEAVDTAAALQGASSAHWVGTDALGRDLLARVLVATRLSIGLALLATSIAVVLGVVLGTAPVVLGGRAGRAVTAGVNIAVAFPGLLLALFFAVVFGVGATGAVLAIGVAGAPSFARLSQTLAAGVAERDYVAAARIAGAGRLRVLVRHVLPNTAEPLVVNATIGAGGSLLAFAGLSFLGLGVQAPAYDWGRMLQDGLSRVYVDPEAALAPGAAIVVAGLAFNLFGESVARSIGLGGTVRGVPLPRPPRRRAAAAVPPSPAPGRETDGADRADRVVDVDAADGAVDVDRAVSVDPAGGAAPDDDAVLDVEDLRVTFPGAAGPVQPVRGVSLRIRRGEAVGVVGESGSGKSLTALAVAGLVEEPGRVEASRARFCGTDLLAAPTRSSRRLLGTSFAMVFQDPSTSLNPTRRVGRQLAEVAEVHQGASRRQALARAVDRLRSVRIPAAERRARQYPHQFSGGMRQRAMIGMGLMGTPALVVADEPTTALDVTVQRQVLDLLSSIRASDGVALLLISHDMTVVTHVCERVLVMYAGRVVEDLPAAELRTGARHPYTRALVAAVPELTADLDAPLAVIPGRAVDPADQPAGCAFAPRCPLAVERCTREDPALVADSRGRRVACWRAGEPIELDSRDGHLLDADAPRAGARAGGVR